MADEAPIEILVNGLPFTGWLDYRSRHSFDKCSGELDLTMSPLPGAPLPIHRNDFIVAIVGGTPVLTGYVRQVSGDDDWERDIRVIHARDQTQDFVDSTVGIQKGLPPPVSLQQILQATVKGMGLTIPVIDKAGTEPFEQGEVPRADVTETGHHFGDRVTRQRQSLLNTDGKGSLVIDRNKGQMGPGMLFRASPESGASAANNILKAKFRDGDLGDEKHGRRHGHRHNLHGVSAQHSPNDKTYWESKAKSFLPAQADPLQKNWGAGFDNTVRPQLRRHVRAHHSVRKGKTADAAKWRANVAKGRGFQYHATVQGFWAVPGVIWWPGTIIPVFDYKYEIAAELLIVDVCFHWDWKGGRRTELTLSYPDAFSTSDGQSSVKAGRTASYGSGAGTTQSLADASDLTG